VSIIVPVLDEVASLPELASHLHSLVARETAGDCGVLVVDGGSTDDTRHRLEGLGLPWMEAERGRAAQMNAGAHASGGEILVFLHADSRLPTDALGLIRDAVRGGARGGFFAVRLQSRSLLLRMVGRMISLRSRLTGIATGDQALWTLRETFEQLGGFAPLPLFEDVDMSRRLRSLGGAVALRAEVTTSARRWEQHGPWRTILSMWLLRSLYACGVAPARLARYYGTAR
jgi:rSAM/selenodomain-associated transferase 2